MRSRTALMIGILVLLTISPTVLASTLTVNLNPSTKTAKVHLVSLTKVILTYPADSSLSRSLRGVNSSYQLSGNFSGNSNSETFLQGRFEDYDGDARLQGLAVNLSVRSHGNDTALVVFRVLDITMSLKGIFKVVNGTVHADLRWREFTVPGEMKFDFGPREVEGNRAGSVLTDEFRDRPLVVGFFLNAFGSEGLWNSPTLNYSSLSTPLTTWTKSYDSATNFTTFSKIVQGQSTLLASATLDGKKYTLSVVSDPSASITTKGYALPLTDSLVLLAPPPALGPGIPLVAISTAAAAGLLSYYLIRRRHRGTMPSTPINPPM